MKKKRIKEINQDNRVIAMQLRNETISGNNYLLQIMSRLIISSIIPVEAISSLIIQIITIFTAHSVQTSPT